MGQGGNFKLFNATPYNLVKTKSHSYQMSDWKLPDTIWANTSAGKYLEFSEGIFKDWDDDGADDYYSLSGTAQILHVMARAKNDSNSQPGVDFWLQYQSSWSNDSSAPLTSPFYMFSTTDDNNWKLLNNDVRRIGWHWNREQQAAVELRIVQINQYTANEQEALDIVTDLQNGNLSSPRFRGFLTTVYNALDKM